MPYFYDHMRSTRFSLPDQLLYEDKDFFVINKPPFIATLEDRHDASNILKEMRAIEPDAQVCHRLDKDTSGALAIARNPEAYRHLSMQFENRQVTKIYHAIADGIHSFKEELVNAPILKQNGGTVRISREGKQAETYFTTLQTFKNHSLIECRPITGRMHQIRIHLSLIKASITGDEMYGGKPFFVSSIKRGFNLKKLAEEQPLMKRMALHAYSLEFVNIEGKQVNIQAPYPKDFQALLRQLGVHNR